MEEKSRILNKLNSDQSRPVLFDESFGGSENQMRFLLDHLPDESFKNINLILNNADHKLLENERINILWVQHFVNQAEIQNLEQRIQQFQMDKFGPNSGEIYRISNQLFAPVQAKIQAAIDKVGKERGYDYIIDALSGALVYALPQHDLTDDVIEELRKTSSDGIIE